MDPSVEPPAPAPPPSAPATLEEGEQAFQQGDWRRARAIAREEMASADPARRAAARTLGRRFAADPQLLAVYLLALLTFAAVVWRYLVARA